LLNTRFEPFNKAMATHRRQAINYRVCIKIGSTCTGDILTDSIEPPQSAPTSHREINIGQSLAIQFLSSALKSSAQHCPQLRGMISQFRSRAT